MWLLSTDRAELRAFVSPNTVPDGYAILSHVWDAEEQTFTDVRKLGKKCARRGENPRDFVCEKIRRCCHLAEQHGYKWVWIDTCCIDKSSSSELSEAINSMFYYYSLASICYAYLRDVPTGTSAAPFSVKFMDSMWHKRGWTLQELLAPRLVLFVSSSWNIIGSKVDMAEDLEDITDIPSAVLKHEQALSDISIAQRMWWAAERETTRAEDEAYCLLGIFGITMPTLYGEGRQAFQRLQEEIMKRSPDTTLFAWGPRCGIGALRGYSSHCNSGILAISPSQFRCSSGIIYKPELANLHASLREKVRSCHQHAYRPGLILGVTRSSSRQTINKSCPSQSLRMECLLGSVSFRWTASCLRICVGVLGLTDTGLFLRPIATIHIPSSHCTT